MTHRTCGERGSISIWLAVSSFVMMMLVGLAVDLGGQVHAKQRAHNIAAEAARTGGEQVQAAPAIKGEYFAVDTVAARNAAEDYLAASGVTGTVTVPLTMSPDAIPAFPEVAGAGAAGVDDVDDAGAAAAGVDADVLAELLSASPMPLMALSASESGALRLTPSTSPEAAPSVPLVEGSDAFAAPMPASERPPRMTVNHSPLDTILFMMKLPRKSE